MKKSFTTNTENQTINLGKEFAQELKHGSIIGLSGDLGSGKTQFVKGLAQGLGINKSITSPTFVLLKPYHLPVASRQLIHIDCYRLSSPDEILSMGLQEYIDQKNNIIAIEWADKIKSILSKDTIWVDFTLGTKASQRLISIKS